MKNGFRKQLISIDIWILILAVICLSIIIINGMSFRFFPLLNSLDINTQNYIKNKINEFAMGYIVSYFFYLLVVKYPEKRNDAYVKSSIAIFVENIVNYSSSILYILHDDLTENHNAISMFNLRKDDIERLCRLFNSEKKHHIDLLYNKIRAINESSNRIFQFVPYVDTELIHLINKILNSSMHYAIERYFNISVDGKKLEIEEFSTFNLWTKSYYENVLQLESYFRNCLDWKLKLAKRLKWKLKVKKGKERFINQLGNIRNLIRIKKNKT
ncbi:MAG: hypothetical protein N3I35_14435 [Clostridia bacterium]|nr:hypothetical protein [Clostridia bacterium]